MVGIELPTPETRESTRQRRRRCSRSTGSPWRDARRARLLDDVSLRRSRAARSSASPASRATGRASCIEALHRASIRRRVRHDRARRRPTSPTCRCTRPPRDAGSATSPRTASATGSCCSAPLWENVMLGHQTRAPFTNGFWIDRKGALPRTDEIVERVRRAHARHRASPPYALSGGNQQKLIIGREMLAQPSVLIAAHPTRGIDVGAQAAVWDDLRDARDGGPGDAAHLGRPRRADRPLRHAARHAPTAAIVASSTRPR